MAKTGATLSFFPLLVGGVLGIFTGVFFGDDAAVFRPIGQIYIMLLEVAVYPYLIASLLHGLSSMSPDRAWRLFRNGWPFYLFIWGVTFGLLALLSLGIPQALPSSLESPKGSLPKMVNQFLGVLIPSDFFSALSNNSVPAVVLFCIFFGVALQQVKEKKALLEILDDIRRASFIFWSFIVKMVPVAVFALLADTAGTTHVQNLSSIGLFLFLFFVGIIILSFWLVPGCLQALTPLRFPEVIANLRSALAIALVTTLPVSALPLVMEATRKLAEQCGVDDPEKEEVSQTHLSVAYPLGQLGNFFVYLFIIFATFNCGKAISTVEAIFLPVITLLSCFGTPAASVNAVSFISESYHLPASVSALYVELMTILRYGQVVASVMGFAFLSFTVTLAYYGKVRVRWMSLAGVLVTGAVVSLGIAFSTRVFYLHYLDDVPNPYLSFSLDPAVTKGIDVSFANEDDPVVIDPNESTTDRIERTGVLRVGYNAGVIPFCYRNSSGNLVGYDVAFAYQLARDLNVKLRFVPYRWEDLDARIEAGAFDIAVSGIYVTRERLVGVGVSNPYFQSPLAFFTLRDRGAEFTRRDQLLDKPDLRIGIFDDSVLIPTIRRTLPQAQIVMEPPYSTVPDFSKIDAAFWTLTQADALAAAHPQLIAVQTKGIGNPFLFAYLTPPHSDELLRLINYSLAADKTSGFEQAQTDYWINRLPRPDTTPRWSILRNVLGVGKDRH
jgi:Na+/H+-dicarboxylate symporter/ABC-type amino acid transport substrate-binding protein